VQCPTKSSTLDPDSYTLDPNPYYTLCFRIARDVPLARCAATSTPRVYQYIRLARVLLVCESKMPGVKYKIDIEGQV